MTVVAKRSSTLASLSSLLDENASYGRASLILCFCVTPQCKRASFVCSGDSITPSVIAPTCSYTVLAFAVSSYTAIGRVLSAKRRMLDHEISVGNEITVTIEGSPVRLWVGSTKE